MKVGMVAAALVAASVVVAAFSPALAQDNAPAGNAKAGQQVFRSVGCWQCHGSQAQGVAITGPRLATTALPYAAFLQQLRTPANAMPAYEPKILSNSEAANIYAWLKSLPAAKSAADIPLLSNN